MKKRKFTKRYYLILALVTTLLTVGVIFRISSHSKSKSVQNEQRIKSVFKDEDNKLHNPLRAFGVKEDQSEASCEQIITAVRKNQSSLHGQRCTKSVGGYVYITSDADEERVVAAAKRLNQDLKNNGWQPEGGHADIAFWVNHLAENREILATRADNNPFFMNSLNKQRDEKTSCWSNAFSSVGGSNPVGIRINFSCTYSDSQ